MSEAISRQAIKKVMERVGKHSNVVGTVLCDMYGLPLESSMPPEDGEAIAANIASLVGKIKSVSQEITGDQPKSIRIETSAGVIEVIPDYEAEITVVALIQQRQY